MTRTKINAKQIDKKVLELQQYENQMQTCTLLRSVPNPTSSLSHVAHFVTSTTSGSIDFSSSQKPTSCIPAVKIRPCTRDWLCNVFSCPRAHQRLQQYWLRGQSFVSGASARLINSKILYEDLLVLFPGASYCGPRRDDRRFYAQIQSRTSNEYPLYVSCDSKTKRDWLILLTCL